MTARIIPFPHSRVRRGARPAQPSDWDASFVALGLLRTAQGTLRANRRLILREDDDQRWSIAVIHPQRSVELRICGDETSSATDLLAALQHAIFDQDAAAEHAADM